MDILNEMYSKSVAENERNLRFWSDYLHNLKSLDFSTYSDNLKVPILVPIGSRILFRGELKHTNEVTVALGADYFVKCSVKQADILRQHRIKGAQEKFDIYNKEKEYLLNQMNFTKQNVYENQGQEIIEYHTEEEDKTWRDKHRKNVKLYMQTRGKEKAIEKSAGEISEEELWERLEELELQEELKDELNSMNNVDNNISLQSLREKDSLVVPEDLILKNTETLSIVNKDKDKAEKEMRNKKVTFEAKAPEQTSKLDLLQQVIDRQNELGEKLQELKNRERTQTKSELDLMARLDELEQLDELEDEMERIEDIIEKEDIEESEEEDYRTPDTANLQRRVSFVDEDNSETLNLTFKHSEEEPDNEPYDSEKGIQKPSDIYQAHSHLFESGTTSILKKSKFAADDELREMLRQKPVVKVEKDSTKQVAQPAMANHSDVAPQTIIVKDIVEKVRADDKKLLTEAKPMSLFKKKRMQNKS